MKRIFTEHPHSVGETYLQHCLFASKFGIKLWVAGFACLIHAIFPFVFQKTASNMILKMILRFLDRMPAGADRQRVLAKLGQHARHH